MAASYLSLQDIIQTQIPYLLGLTQNDAQVSAAVATEFVNIIQSEIAARERVRDSKLLLDYADYTVDNTAEDTNALPANMDELIALTNINAGADEELQPIPYILKTSDVEARNYGYYVRGNKTLVFVNMPAETFRLWFRRHPAKLHWGTTATHDADGITLASSPSAGSRSAEADYYNHCEIAITAVSSGSGAGQIVPVTDYTAAGVASVDWVTQPTGGVTLTYSILSFLPHNWHHLLSYGAAALFFARKPQICSQLQARYEQALQEFEMSLTPGDLVTPFDPTFKSRGLPAIGGD